MGGDGAESQLPRCNSFQAACHPGSHREVQRRGRRPDKLQGIITTLRDRHEERCVFGGQDLLRGGVLGHGKELGLRSTGSFEDEQGSARWKKDEEQR